VLVATGRYLGEGFDDARLDTLFLTLPVSWRGTLAQYAGRLHRLHAAKREVLIYDYIDVHAPLFVKMAAKREVGYRSLGYYDGPRCQDIGTDVAKVDRSPFFLALWSSVLWRGGQVRRAVQFATGRAIVHASLGAALK